MKKKKNSNKSNSNNTIIVSDFEDEDNIFPNYQNINSNLLDNKSNKNSVLDISLDIDHCSQINRNIPENNKNKNSTDFKNNNNLNTLNKLNQNSDNIQINFSPQKNSPLESYQISSFDSKIKTTNSNNIIYKDNILPNGNNKRTPLVKNLINKDSNESKNEKNLIINNNINEINNPFKKLNLLFLKKKTRFY